MPRIVTYSTLFLSSGYAIWLISLLDDSFAWSVVPDWAWSTYLTGSDNLDLRDFSRIPASDSSARICRSQLERDAISHRTVPVGMKAPRFRDRSLLITTPLIGERTVERAICLSRSWLRKDFSVKLVKGVESRWGSC